MLNGSYAHARGAVLSQNDAFQINEYVNSQKGSILTQYRTSFTLNSRYYFLAYEFLLTMNIFRGTCYI